MISEQAVVTRRDGTRVEVRLLRESACGGCELGKGCGTGAIGRLLGSRQRPLSVECADPLEPGERIQLQFPETALVRASLAIYGLPLLAMLAAGVTAASVGIPEIAVAAVSLSGLYLGIRLASRYSARLERDGMKPRVVGIGAGAAGRHGIPRPPV